MTFGIDPASRGESPVVWWGARAIYHGPRVPVDYVFDRAQTTPYDKQSLACNALWFWLDKCGKPALELKLREKVVSPSSEEDIIVESLGFKLIANPRRSYGYLYLGAWPTSPIERMPPEPEPNSAAGIALKAYRKARGYIDDEPLRARTTIVNDDEFRGGRRLRRR